MIFNKAGFFFLILLLIALTVYSELPPYVYEDLKEDAEIILHLEVLNVRSLGFDSSHSCQKNFRVHALVTAVERTCDECSMLEPGDLIFFNSYTIDRGEEKPECEGLVGPGSPIALENNDCIKAYLTSDGDLAALGDSLERVDC